MKRLMVLSLIMAVMFLTWSVLSPLLSLNPLPRKTSPPSTTWFPAPT